MSKDKNKSVREAILKLLRKYPKGLNIKQIRERLGKAGTQQHIDRRLRELYRHYDFRKPKDGTYTTYILIGPKKEGNVTATAISQRVRAAILNLAGGRCQMCGSTISKDKIRLHIDHRIPQSWGGSSEPDNLWAICSTCNEGKKNYFATFDDKTMQKVLSHKSVHKKIAELLHLKAGEWVDSDLIAFVANADGMQADWQKRLRELRYFNLKIENHVVKKEKRRVSEYRLTNWTELPKDITSAAREFERNRASRNKKN